MKQLILLAFALLTYAGIATAQPILVGHRGSYYGVENTSQAFINGAQRGYEYLETDVKVTKDGYHVCSHNDALTNLGGTLTIASSNLADLQAETLTQTRGGVKYTGHLCTIAEYLDICTQYNVKPLIELKWATKINSNDCSGIPALIKLIEDKGFRNKVIILTSMKPCLEYIRTNYPDIELQFLTGEYWANHFDWCVKWRIDANIQAGYFDKSTVDRYHANGLKVNMWTTNTTSGYKQYGNMGCDFITTDYLDPSNLPALDITPSDPVVPPTPSVDPHFNEYAYGLSATLNAAGKYDISYSCTGATKGAKLVLTPKDASADVVTYDLPAPVKGVNTYTIDPARLKDTDYEWEILVNNEANPSGALLFSESTADSPSGARGGVVCITDPMQPSFGYVSVTYGKNGGIDVYSPDRTRVAVKALKDDSRLDATNSASMFRGDELDGKAVFADWSDKGAGYWVFDPMNPSDMTQMLLGTKDSKGSYTYNGQIIGGGSSCVAFQYKGTDNLRMYSFVEDYPAGNTSGSSNRIYRYDLGSERVISAPPVKAFDNLTGSSHLANQNVNIIAVDEGFFASQCRASGSNTATNPGFLFADNDGNIIFNSSTLDLPTGCSSGIALTRDKSILAVKGYTTNIYIFNVKWNGSTPSFTLKTTISSEAGSNWDHMCFDYANNLCVLNGQRNDGLATNFKIYAIPSGESEFSTPAAKDCVIKGSPAPDPEPDPEPNPDPEPGTSDFNDVIDRMEEVWTFSGALGNTASTGWVNIAASGENMLRDLEALNGKLYAANNTLSATGCEVSVIDGATGAFVKSLSTDGIAGGRLMLGGISSIGGKLIASNSATTTHALKVYKWADDDSAPELWFTDPSTHGDIVIGDQINTSGDMTDGYIWFSNAAKVVRYKVTDGNVNPTPEVINLENGTATNQGSADVAPMADGTFWVTGSQTSPMLYNANGSLIGTLDINLPAPSKSAKQGTAMSIIPFGERTYIAATTYLDNATTISKGAIAIIDITDALASLNSGLSTLVGVYPSDGLSTVRNVQFQTGVTYELANNGTKLNVWGCVSLQGATHLTFDGGNDSLVGDANGDGEITVADVVYICNKILGTPAADFVEAAADIDGDGEITVTDVVFLVNIITKTSEQ